MLNEVRTQASAVLQITEEKRELLATQNQLLEQQVVTRTAELNQSLVDLKTTQVQLIQKEKLANLGELTAGIAHEIQNPLNFVNNFSEVSTELIEEFKEGPFQKLPPSQKSYAEEILGDLIGNLQKIQHHGERASNIVKGMLDHARTESGEKRPADLNALADEYLKIAYYGIRAKDLHGLTDPAPTDRPEQDRFQCELVTDFDAALKLVEVAPQEIGRVLINLYNNAFYAVWERWSGIPASQTRASDYKPTVTVSTRQLDDRVEIQVRDNGIGMAAPVLAKIFQPFFTTKPPGKGTGLGLSLSYDMITKGHGGNLTVESQEGSGTTFVIQLPQNRIK
ncbi:sensor histidine kinase [Larkinella insperata]|uniref:histidine kinase n=1 Tax=Larkinella insperata TaxID=332158 RepID=A0ABW3QHW0_9BACT